jgi:hypothetical protein
MMFIGFHAPQRMNTFRLFKDILISAGIKAIFM